MNVRNRTVSAAETCCTLLDAQADQQWAIRAHRCGLAPLARPLAALAEIAMRNAAEALRVLVPANDEGERAA